MEQIHHIVYTVPVSRCQLRDTRGTRRGHAGGTQGARRGHAGGTQGARRGHAGGTQGARRGHAGGTQGARRRHAGDTQEARRRHAGGTQGIVLLSRIRTSKRCSREEGRDGNTLPYMKRYANQAG